MFINPRKLERTRIERTAEWKLGRREDLEENQKVLKLFGNRQKL